MTDSDPASEKVTQVSRRGLLKWAGALAAVGVVGAGLGFGGDLLLRPNTVTTATQTSVSTATKTNTQAVTATQTATVTQPAAATTETATMTKTATQTVTAPPPTLSYVPPLSPSVQAKVDAVTQQLIGRHTGDTVTYACCSPGDRAGCFFKVYLNNGKIKSIVTDDTINAGVAREDNLGPDAVKKGRLQSRACSLGYGLPSMVYDPNRVLYPMKLVGPKGSGQYLRITWTEALDTIYQNLKGAIDKYGPYSIMLMGFTNPRLLQLLKTGVITWGDQSGSGYSTACTLAMGRGGGSGSQADIFHSKLVVLFGYLPTILEGNGNTESLYIHSASEQGVKFISIDPRYTIDSQAIGSQWIPIKPGTDLALVLAMADVMFQQNSWNQTFVGQWVEPTGFAKWKDYVTGVADGVEKSPEWAEAICGIPAATIRALVALILLNNPTKIHIGYEMCRSTSTNLVRAALIFQAMTGYFFSKGGGCGFGTIGSNPWGANTSRFFTADNYKSSWTLPVAFNILKWQKAILLRPQLDNGTLTPAQYNGLIGMKADLPPVNIKVWTTAHYMKQHTLNIFGAAERIAAIKQVFSWGAFSRIDSNALYMDIILPAVERFMEEPGETSGGGLNRFYSPSCGYTWRAYSAPVIEPLGEARPDEWYNLMLAKRFGVSALYNPDLDPVLAKDEWNFGKWNTTIEALHQKGYETWMQAKDIAPLNPPSWTDFKKKPIWREDGVDEGPFALYIDASQNPFSLTASTKLEPYSKYLSDPNIAATTLFGPATAGTCLGKIGPGATPIPTWVPNLEYTVFDPKSKDYPLLLITPNSQHRNHSYGANNPLNSGDCYRHSVWISATDANARGIKDGDMVRIYSNVGEIYMEAYVTSRMLPGLVAIYHGGHYKPNGIKSQTMPDGIDTGGACNLLIEDVQPGNMMIGPCIGTGPVQVAKL